MRWICLILLLGGCLNCWVEGEMDKGDREMEEKGRIIYAGEQLKNIAMPMGGIGTGSIAIAGDGQLVEWQIFNNVNKRSFLPFTWFMIWTKEEDKEPIAKLLQTKSVEGLSAVDELKFIGEYPMAQILFKDRGLPLDIRLTAFSPMIPLNSKDSGLPAVYFMFTIKNLSSQNIAISLGASLQNGVGYDGHTLIEGIENSGYQGNSNSFIQKENFSAIHMTSSLKKEAPTYGSMTLATPSIDVSAYPQWDDLKQFWDDYKRDGRFEEREIAEPAPNGKTYNGAISVPFFLTPGQIGEVTFTISWHFPNRYRDWAGGEGKKYRLGNMYNNWFKDSLQVADYAVSHANYLIGGTKKFHDTFYDSSLPYYLLDCISSQISTLATTTVMWLEDGTLAAFEGSGDRSGCCPMNCTHVWNYEQTMAFLYPDLERNMRYTDLMKQMREDGGIRFRTDIPLSLPRQWPHVCADGQPGTILKLYREWLLSGEREFLDELWPYAKKAMQFLMEKWDPDGNGMIDIMEDKKDIPQHNTYDINFFGPNSYVGSLYLASLRAAETMARIEGEKDLEKLYRMRYKIGRRNLDSICWNGTYFEQIVDEEKHPEHQYGKGVLSDQVIGQWWAHIVGLDYILPKEHVRSALRAIMKYNFRTDFFGFHQRPRKFAFDDEMGLLICTWPQGGRQAKPVVYADEVWTGIEYQVAAHMIYEGMVKEGLTIVRAARSRYNGRRRSPWNEIECGNHYARAMSSWSLLLAASGFHYDPEKMILTFSPQKDLGGDNFRSFYSNGKGWGSFSQIRKSRQQENSIDVKYGELLLKSLKLNLPKGARRIKRISVKAGEKKVALSIKRNLSEVTISLAKPIRIGEDESLLVQILW